MRTKLRPFAFLITAFALPLFASAQVIPFVNQTSLLPNASVHSGNSIAICDMNNDGKDDIVRADQNITMTIDYQQAPNAAFTESSFGNYLDDPWAMCVGDVDNDGFNDVLWGDNNVYVYRWNGSAYVGGNATQAANAGYIFVQGTNFADINNDGMIDVFACNDDVMPHIYLGDGLGGWTNGQSIMPLATVPASDNSGNYASIWTDINNDGLIDLLITHCRQGVTNASDARRIDQVFISNGNGTYTQDITNWTGLRDGAQGWSTATGDIDNDGDMDLFVLNYDVNSKLMLNDGSGVFTDIISSSGILNTTTIFGENATFQDFNNDGYVDLFISGNSHLLYVNNGNNTFTLDANAFDANSITAHAYGDLNGDGFLDIYASYCNIFQSPSGIPDKVWMNASPQNGNTNHWVKFNLQGVISNRNAIGAIVKIYGPWGVQVREVHSGEGYGIQNSFTVHFGLGQNTAIDSTVIIWPSGVIDHVMGAGVDAANPVIEGSAPLSVHNSLQHTLQITVSPNPAKSNPVIRLEGYSAYGLENLTLNIYDVNGKLVHAEAGLKSNAVTISSESLGSGMYFVEIRDAHFRIATERMLIE